MRLRAEGLLWHRSVRVYSDQVVKIDTVLNLVYVKGAVPGHEVRAQHARCSVRRATLTLRICVCSTCRRGRSCA